jgi:hypothetical protein
MTKYQNNTLVLTKQLHLIGLKKDITENILKEYLS